MIHDARFVGFWIDEHTSVSARLARLAALRRSRIAPKGAGTVDKGAGDQPAAAERVTTQALAQQQQAFEWQLDKDRSLFRLHIAMGWTTFGLLPLSAIAWVVAPDAAPCLVALAGLAGWNWRRMLRRDAGYVGPTTKNRQ